MKCKECGEIFVFNEEAEKFNSYFDGEHDYAYDGWENYCADCAISNTEHENENGDGGLSVYKAADIWASNGKDEDYMFGYSEEELEEALKL